jgi:hypothetical protein
LLNFASAKFFLFSREAKFGEFRPTLPPAGELLADFARAGLSNLPGSPR